jgi:hypothetical protein
MRTYRTELEKPQASAKTERAEMNLRAAELRSIGTIENSE